jgi:hypothetical protein
MAKTAGIVTGAVYVGKHHLCLNTVFHHPHGYWHCLETSLIEGDAEDFNGPWDALAVCLNRKYFFQGNCYRHGIVLVEADNNPDYTYWFVSRFQYGDTPVKTRFSVRKNFNFSRKPTLIVLALHSLIW